MPKPKLSLSTPEMSEVAEDSADRALLAELRRLAPWHLDVEVRNGIRTSDIVVLGTEGHGAVKVIDPRPAYVQLVRRIYPSGLGGLTVLDCACNCGGYVFWSKELDAGDCFGFDVREHWIRQARFLLEERSGPSDGIRFEVCDLYDLPAAIDGDFDISIFKGIFYHLPDPITGLKLVADRTKELLILNTATRSAAKDGFLAVANESPDWLMSGVYGLNWFPTGPRVLDAILSWMGFPATRVIFWEQESPGEAELGRIEMVAARDEATLRHFDEARPVG